MKLILALFLVSLATQSFAQQWKTLPKGVRILGYRNVQTSKIKENFNQFRSESALGASFTVDAATIDQIPAIGGALSASLPPHVYKNLVVGSYSVDAQAEANVHGTGFGWGLTDKVMFYAEVAYYNARVKAKIKRTQGNTYDQVAEYLENQNGGVLDATLAANLRMMIDADERSIQSFITNQYNYKPIGTWNGAGWGDMETGLMINVIDRGTTGLVFYPGVVLPTGRVDDPDILQDMGFGDGQFDLFAEIGTGWIMNDYISFGTTGRFTYQAPSTQRLRSPTDRSLTISDETDSFKVKYGNRFNYMANVTFSYNDWLSFTPYYRFMYQLPSEYTSSNALADDILSTDSNKMEHQVQLTTTISSIQPFLKKRFLLPAQINLNIVQTVAGQNVPKVGRYEIEFRMLF